MTEKVKVILVGVVAFAVSVGAILTMMASHQDYLQSPDHDRCMVKIEAINCGLMSLEEDSWLGSVTTVNYNGNVYYTDNYRFSGPKQYQWILTEDQLDEAYAFFVKNKNQTITTDSAVDGVQYKITFYKTTGVIMYDKEGYIYDTDFENIENYIGSRPN